MGFEDSKLLASICDGDSERRWCAELLLRMCCESISAFSSWRFRAKNEAFEAVIGVLGVVGTPRRGGGVVFPSTAVGSCKAAILAAVGVLKGSKFRGGSRRGCRFFLTGVELFCWSTSEFEPTGAWYRCFGSRSDLTGSLTEPLPDKLFVEVLFILLVSNGKLDFRLLKSVGSAGDSFGDSYALGIAGTGGTSSSSSLPAALCKLLAFGAGSRDDGAGGGTLGCRELVEVRVALKLAFDPVERREPKFKFIDDGVGVFRGSAEGERDEVRIVEASGWVVGGVFGIGGVFFNNGAFCKIDNRFALLASVGLMVLAPRPVA
jgi:hypothetical protein